jgi:hypothetical protein
MDKTSGVALELKTGVPTYQVEDEEGRTHLFTGRSRKRMNTPGVSGGRITPALIRDQSLRVRWLRNSVIGKDELPT